MAVRAYINRLLKDKQVSWLLRSGAGLGGARMFNMAIGIVLTVFLARTLGAEDYGFYTFVLGWAFILSMPLQLGLPTLLTRQIAVYRTRSEPGPIKGLMRWGFKVSAIGAAVVFMVCMGTFLFVYLTQGWPRRLEPWLIGSAATMVIALALLNLYRAIVCGFETVILGNIPDMILRPTLFLGLAVAASGFLALTPGSVMTLHLTGTVIAVAATWWFAQRQLHKFSGFKDTKPIYDRSAWLISLWPLTLQASAALINTRLDIAMLGFITGSASVAIYDIGAKFGGLMMITQALLNASIAPRIARLYASEKIEELRALLVQACRMSFLASALLFAAICFLGTPILKTLFGPEFNGAYLVALILAVGFLFDTAVGAVGLVLDMTGNEKVTGKAFVISVVVNATLNCVLIPLFGPYGAALTTTFSRLVMQGFLWWKVLDIIDIRCDIAVIGARRTQQT